MIIVTGGAGFIGSALIWGLNQKGIRDIIVVDAIGHEASWKNLVGRQFHSLIHKTEFFQWWEANNKDVDFVFHMGACSSTTETDMDYLLENNTQYSQKLFELCARDQVPLVYASSAATYGLGELGFSDKEDLISKLRPINPYGFSKQMMDTWALQQKNTPPFWAGFKFFNVFGPGEGHKGEMMSLVAKAIPQIRETNQLKLFKSYKEGCAHGEQSRDFVYIKDVVDILLHVWENDKSLESGIFNLGTGKARSFADLGRAVFSALNKETKFEWIEMPSSIRSQYQYFTEADMERCLKGLKYTKEFASLEDSVADYVTNYLAKDTPFL